MCFKHNSSPAPVPASAASPMGRLNDIRKLLVYALGYRLLTCVAIIFERVMKT